MADKDLVTLHQLKGVCMTTGGRQACVKYLAPLNEAMWQYQINTRARISIFLAQIAHESGDFQRVEEGLNYSSDGLANTWPTRYAIPKSKGGYVLVWVKNKWRNMPNALALQLERNPIAIANNAYANRFGNGDEASGDGWRYRGAGLKQLTFKDNHEAFGDAVGIPVAKVGDFLRTPEGAALSAAWYWDSRKLNALADVGAFTRITEKINGGQIGARSRLEYFALAQKAF